MTRSRMLHWPAVAALGCAVLLPAAAPAYGLACTAGGAVHRDDPHDRTGQGTHSSRSSLGTEDDDPRELAGSPAGAGRERPGRPAGERANPEALLAARPVPLRPKPPPPPPPQPPPPPAARPEAVPEPEVELEPDAPPAPPVALGTEPNARAADLAAHILPLGTGFALMGVGLGFIGIRLRRG
ncbi:hypothetical protein [Streptomyces sp. NPDC051211]|uniref:hypothetical protein n=1 Tax=Streptomyces sp. NPDC051211 TaxID=3154643 RepID=UPI00344D1FC5